MVCASEEIGEVAILEIEELPRIGFGDVVCLVGEKLCEMTMSGLGVVHGDSGSSAVGLGLAILVLLNR